MSLCVSLRVCDSLSVFKSLYLCGPAQVSGRRRPGQAVGDVVGPRVGEGGGLCRDSGAFLLPRPLPSGLEDGGSWGLPV